MLYIFGNCRSDSDFVPITQFEKYTNIIPIIGKSDQYNAKGLYEAKMNIVNQAKKNKANFFDVISTIEQINKKELRE